MFALGAVRFSLSPAAMGPRPAASVRVLIFVMLAATFEELAFRGYAFQRLIEALGPVAATLLSSLLFGLAHYQNPQATLLGALNTALAGVVLALAYLRTRGLWMPIGLHIGWNVLLGIVFAFPVSGYRLAATGLEARLAGPAWLTGGGFGPEGSVVLTVVAALAVLVLGRLRGLAASPGQHLGVDCGEEVRAGG
jgi:membrane protease YdiL (CAAX protease family)